MNNTNSKISKKSSQSQISINHEQIECRICLQGSQNHKDIISPCKCIGSVEMIHYQCLKRWIQKKVSQEIKTIDCQLCKHPYSYQVQRKFACRDSASIKNQINKNTAFFIYVIVLSLLCLGSLIAFSTILITLPNQKQLQKIVLFVGFSIVLTLFLIFSYALIINFVIGKQNRVISIDNFHKKKIRKTRESLNDTLYTLNANKCENDNKIYPALVQNTNL